MRLREEMADQLRALHDLKTMATSYGFDIGRPATNAREAVQWTYFGYLGAVKENNGAAMSVGRVSTLLRHLHRARSRGRDADRGRSAGADRPARRSSCASSASCARRSTTRCSRAIRTGRPSRVGGMALDGRTLWSRAASFRMLHTLTNLGPAPEPNLTVLWSQEPARRLQALLPRHQPRHLVAAVRERRPHGAACTATTTASRAASRPCASASRCSSSARGSTSPSACSTRSTADATRSAARRSRPAYRAGHRRRARLRGRGGEVRRHDGLAGADLRPRDELHPLLARPLQLRAPADGAARSRHLPHDGLRHRRAVDRRRQPLRDQVRQGQADPRARTASSSTTRRRAISRSSATTTRGWTTSPPTW